jgi:Trk-type K+ transport system membrane component
MRLAGLLVLCSLLLQHGFPIGTAAIEWLNWLDVFLALCFGGDLVLALFKHRKWKRVFELRRFEYLLLGVFLALLTVSWALPSTIVDGSLRFLHLSSAGALLFNLLKLFLLFSVCIQLLRGMQKLFDKGVRPELILAGSFATLIIIGTILLLLPNSSAKTDSPIGGVDALFTATSAVCVTGLVVRDTGKDFTNLGQMIILVLIQIGGLGVITFVAFLSVFSTRALPVPQMVAFRQIVNVPSLSDLKRQIVGILLTTAIIELSGVILIYVFLPGGIDPLGRIKWCVFHSVSAFCNAGFALQSDSLVPFQSNAGLMFTFMALIVLGGLGFLVIPELLAYRFTRGPFFRRIGFFRRLHAGQVSGRLSVQTRLALHVTWILLVVGLVLFWALEFNYILRDRSLGVSFMIAAFKSVTPRTAGFNNVPIHELRDATLILLMMLMVIGASPVSMGGGVKTVGFGILVLALRALVMRRERVEAFGRMLPVKILFTALSVFVLYAITASLGIFFLTLFDPQLNLQDQAFEVISALSTVGLSTGITADLSPSSKLVICVTMFIGRVGPISLVLSVFQSRRMLTYEFPEEEVVVG